MKKPPNEPTLLSEDDLYLFNEGTHTRLQQKMGAHPIVVDGTPGTMFSVWAPNAESVHVTSVIGSSRRSKRSPPDACGGGAQRPAATHWP